MDTGNEDIHDRCEPVEQAGTSSSLAPVPPSPGHAYPPPSSCLSARLGYEAFSMNLGMVFGGQNPNPMLNFFGMHIQPRTHP